MLSTEAHRLRGQRAFLGAGVVRVTPWLLVVAVVCGQNEQENPALCPGEILLKGFLVPYGIAQNRLGRNPSAIREAPMGRLTPLLL